MLSPLVDTHCHLDLPAFDADREEVLRRAVDQGVSRIIVPAVSLDSIPRVLALVDQYPNVFAAVGIHPNDVPIDCPITEVRARLRDAATHPRVVAIGEIGLDYHWDTTPHDVQHVWLTMQLALASEMALPVILHNRESTQDIIDIISRWAANDLPSSLAGRPGVLHSISARWAYVEPAIRLGFYVGFTGPLTYKKADDVREVAVNAPVSQILVETDGPCLTPQPHRGERNEPAYVRITADKLAEVRNVTTQLIGEQTSANAAQLFNLPDDDHAINS